MKKIFPSGFCVFLLSIFLFADPAFSQEEGPAEGLKPVPEKPNWSSAFEGVQIADAISEVPRLQHVFAVKIDTEAQGISFFSTPKIEEGYESGQKETVRQRTNEFLKQYGLQIAINANFFAVPEGEKYSLPGIASLLGLAISEGNVVSPDTKYSAVFAVSKTGKAKILNLSESEIDISSIRTAVTGNTLLLHDGKIFHHQDTVVHPRTLLGISHDDRYVIMVVIDGRRKEYSDGATYWESAHWLRYFDAWKGLNLDGGGSTTLVIQKDNEPVILNRPSDNAPRYNGNSLGIRALPLSRLP